MTMLLERLRAERVQIYEDSRMSGACGMWHVVVNRGNWGKRHSTATFHMCQTFYSLQKY